MSVFKGNAFLSLLLIGLVSGCATNAGMTRNDAKVLATAGQAATQTLVQQGNQIHSSLASLPITIGLYGILDCRTILLPQFRQGCIDGALKNAKEPRFTNAQNQLLDVIDNRIKAFKALNDAYVAFSDLATYDAGQETAKSIQSAFTSINTLSSSISALVPANPLSPISATIMKVFEGVGSLAADERQEKLILAVSKDLHIATDRMIQALTIERDASAMKSLIDELEKERNRLEKSTLAAGLASPISVLSPFYLKTAPDITLSATPPVQNTDLVVASADLVLRLVQSDRQAKVTATYDQAITALSGISAEHQKLEDKKSIDVHMIVNEVQHLRDVMKALGS